MMNLNQLMNSLLEDAAVRPMATPKSSPTFPVDVFDTGEALLLHASLPGASKESIDIQYEKEVLSIRTTLQTPAPENGEALKRERFSGEVSRQLRVPFPVDIEQAKAEYKDGVLTLTLPKAQAARPHRITLN